VFAQRSRAGRELSMSLCAGRQQMGAALAAACLRNGTSGTAWSSRESEPNPRILRHTSTMKRISGWFTAWAICLVAAVFLVGCSNAATGSVRGVFDGLANQVTHIGGLPSAGDIVLSNPSGTYRATARKDGKFSVRVAPGNYRITGRDPGQSGGVSSCTGSVRAKPGQVAHTVVNCVFH
jgi:hypothetical protein